MENEHIFSDCGINHAFMQKFHNTLQLFKLRKIEKKFMEKRKV